MPSLAYTPTHTPVVKLIVTFLVLVILKIIYKYERGGVCQAVVVGNWLKKDCQSSNVNPETPSFKLNRTLGVIKVFAAPSSSAFPPPAVE